MLLFVKMNYRMLCKYNRQTGLRKERKGVKKEKKVKDGRFKLKFLLPEKKQQSLITMFFLNSPECLNKPISGKKETYVIIKNNLNYGI